MCAILPSVRVRSVQNFPQRNTAKLINTSGVELSEPKSGVAIRFRRGKCVMLRFPVPIDCFLRNESEVRTGLHRASQPNQQRSGRIVTHFIFDAITFSSLDINVANKELRLPLLRPRFSDIHAKSPVDVGHIRIGFLLPEPHLPVRNVTVLEIRLRNEFRSVSDFSSPSNGFAKPKSRIYREVPTSFFLAIVKRSSYTVASGMVTPIVGKRRSPKRIRPSGPIKSRQIDDGIARLFDS